VYWSVAGVCLLNKHRENAAARSAQAKSLNTPTKPQRSWVDAEHAHLHSLAKPKTDAAPPPLDQDLWTTHVALLTLFTGVMLASVMAACTALRTHLFIWTVFSPKYLFAMAWGVAWHLGVSVGLCGVVRWMGMW
jgi:ethanolaminephosphotransferase